MITKYSESEPSAEEQLKLTYIVNTVNFLITYPGGDYNRQEIIEARDWVGAEAVKLPYTIFQTHTDLSTPHNSDGTLPLNRFSPAAISSLCGETPTKNIPYYFSDETPRFIASTNVVLTNFEARSNKHLRNMFIGGMSFTVHGYDCKLKQEVLIKVSPVDLFALEQEDREILQELNTKEARVLANIEKHNATSMVRTPHIYEAGVLPNDSKSTYMIMEKMPGLETSNCNLSNDEIVNISLRLGRFLDEQAKAGIFYQDLKPENVLYDRDTDTLSVIDWGIARGDYLVPEKLVNKPKAEQIADNTKAAFATKLEIGSTNIVSPEIFLTGRMASNSVQHELALLVYQLWGHSVNQIQWVDPMYRDVTYNTHTEPETVLLQPENIGNNVYRVICKGANYYDSYRYPNNEAFAEALKLSLELDTKEALEKDIHS